MTVFIAPFLLWTHAFKNMTRNSLCNLWLLKYVRWTILLTSPLSDPIVPPKEYPQCAKGFPPGL